jgi:V/A-type H+-transporting ATPase subunit F
MNDSGLYVIGDEHAVYGFRLLGVGGTAVDSPEELQQELERALAHSDLKIVLVTRDLACTMRSDIDRLKAAVTTPLIVEIPASRAASTPLPLRRLIQQALGLRLDR